MRTPEPEPGPDAKVSVGESDGVGGSDGVHAADRAAAPGGSGASGDPDGVGSRALVARIGALAGRASELSRNRWFRVAFGLLLVALAAWAVLSQREQVADAVGQLSPGWLVLATLATTVNVALAGMVWRANLADLGSRLLSQSPSVPPLFSYLPQYLPSSLFSSFLLFVPY